MYQTSTGTTTSGSKQQFSLDWPTEVESFTEEHRPKNTYLIILGPLPEWHDSWTQCDHQWFNHQSNPCPSRRDYQEKLHAKAISGLKRAPQQHANLYIIDLLKQICQDDLCRFIDSKGFYLYTDDDRLSDYAAANYVAAAIQEAIDAIFPNQLATPTPERKRQIVVNTEGTSDHRQNLPNRWLYISEMPDRNHGFRTIWGKQ
ncbi:MAG: SGNH hydrolase domain-containing protein [Synechococcaceae cyanobacterium]|nr:SGNH hydrolase domain-containing protein [Synechococcaceae cyanobacterium]